MEQIEERCGRKPGRMVADAGYTSRENIQELAEKNIDFVGNVADNIAKARTNQQRFAATQFVYEAEHDRYICPAGKPLLYEGHDERGGIIYHKYKAAADDCKNCSLRPSCCGGNQKHSRSIVRSRESPAMNRE